MSKYRDSSHGSESGNSITHDSDPKRLGFQVFDGSPAGEAGEGVIISNGTFKHVPLELLYAPGSGTPGIVGPRVRDLIGGGVPAPTISTPSTITAGRSRVTINGTTPAVEGGGTDPFTQAYYLTQSSLLAAAIAAGCENATSGIVVVTDTVQAGVTVTSAELKNQVTPWASSHSLDKAHSTFRFQLTNPDSSSAQLGTISLTDDATVNTTLDTPFVTQDGCELFVEFTFVANDTRNKITATLTPAICNQRLSQGSVDIWFRKAVAGEDDALLGPFTVTPAAIKTIFEAQFNPTGLWQNYGDWTPADFGFDMSLLQSGDLLTGINYRINQTFTADNMSFDDNQTLAFEADAATPQIVEIPILAEPGASTPLMFSTPVLYTGPGSIPFKVYPDIMGGIHHYWLPDDFTPRTVTTHLDANTLKAGLTEEQLNSQYAENAYIEGDESGGPFSMYYGWIAHKQEGDNGPFHFQITEPYGPPTLDADNIIRWFFTNKADGSPIPYPRDYHPPSDDFKIGQTQPVTVPNTPFEVSGDTWLIDGWTPPNPPPGTGQRATSILASIDMYPKDTAPSYNNYIMSEPYECRHRNELLFKLKVFGAIGEGAEKLKVVVWGSQGSPTDSNNDRMWTLIPCNVFGEDALHKDQFPPLELQLDTHAPDMPENYGGAAFTVSKDAIAPYNYIRIGLYLNDPSLFADSGVYLEITVNAREL